MSSVTQLICCCNPPRSDSPLGSGSQALDPESWSKLDIARDVFVALGNIASGAVNVPGLQPAATLVVQIIDIAKQVKSNKEDCVDLAERVADFLQPIAETLKDYDRAYVSEGLTKDLEKFQKTLKQVRATLRRLQAHNCWSRFINHDKDGESIQNCHSMIDRAFFTFAYYGFIDLRSRGPNGQINQMIAQKLEEADIEQETAITALPPPPKPFFGRLPYIAKLLSLVKTRQKVRACILGSAGVGKTATALHILHHPEIVQQFKECRYFVPCDALTTADMLGNALVKALKVGKMEDQDSWALLAMHFASAAPYMVVLDNFETPWDDLVQRSHLKSLLKIIDSGHKMFLLVTMCSTINPTGIEWTTSPQTGILPSLLPEEATKLFVAINPTSLSKSQGSESLNLLLKEIDYVPLAIHLVARVGQGWTCDYLWMSWENKKNSMPQLYGHQTYSHSLSVSIALSLGSKALSDNTGALLLLAFLSNLPDGMTSWDTKLPEIASTLSNPQHLLFILNTLAVTYIRGGSVKVLSPIRQYALAHQDEFLTPEQLEDLKIFRVNYLHQYAGRSEIDNPLENINLPESEVNNVAYVIAQAAQDKSGTSTLEAGLEVVKHLSETQPSQSKHMLDLLLPHLDTVKVEFKAAINQIYSGILLIQKHYKEAEEKLMEAKENFISIGDKLGEAECQRRLDDIRHQKSWYKEANPQILPANVNHLFGTINGQLRAAQNWQDLGKILHMQHQDKEAIQILTKAQQAFLQLNDNLRVAQCSQNLGHIFHRQNQYKEAMKQLTEAKQSFMSINNQLGVAQCLQSLGNILYMQNQYHDASEKLTEARSTFVKLDDQLGAAQCQRSLGDILYMQGQYKEAAEQLTDAEQVFQRLDNKLGYAQCLQSLGHILYVQKQYNEAAKKLTEARWIFLGRAHQLGAAQCLNTLGDILYRQKQYNEAAEKQREAQQIFHSINNKLGVAQCLQSLGKTLYQQKQYKSAVDKFTEARVTFLDIDHQLGAAQCLQNLGNILILGKQYNRATEQLQASQQAFEAIGNLQGAAQCRQSLDELWKLQHKRSAEQTVKTKPFPAQVYTHHSPTFHGQTVQHLQHQSHTPTIHEQVNMHHSPTFLSQTIPPPQPQFYDSTDSPEQIGIHNSPTFSEQTVQHHQPQFHISTTHEQVNVHHSPNFLVQPLEPEFLTSTVTHEQVDIQHSPTFHEQRLQHPDPYSHISTAQL